MGTFSRPIVSIGTSVAVVILKCSMLRTTSHLSHSGVPWVQHAYPTRGLPQAVQSQNLLELSNLTRSTALNFISIKMRKCLGVSVPTPVNF